MKLLITTMKNFPPLLNFVATLPCITFAKVTVKIKVAQFF